MVVGSALTAATSEVAAANSVLVLGSLVEVNQAMVLQLALPLVSVVAGLAAAGHRWAMLSCGFR